MKKSRIKERHDVQFMWKENSKNFNVGDKSCAK